MAAAAVGYDARLQAMERLVADQQNQIAHLQGAARAQEEQMEAMERRHNQVVVVSNRRIAQLEHSNSNLKLAVGGIGIVMIGGFFVRTVVSIASGAGTILTATAGAALSLSDTALATTQVVAAKLASKAAVALAAKTAASHMITIGAKVI